MATLIITHDVQDYSAWKTLFDADTARHDAAGVKLLAVGTKEDSANTVYVIFDGEMDALKGMVNNPELKTVMENAGVIGAPVITYINS